MNFIGRIPPRAAHFIGAIGVSRGCLKLRRSETSRWWPKWNGAIATFTAAFTFSAFFPWERVIFTTLLTVMSHLAPLQIRTMSTFMSGYNHCLDKWWVFDTSLFYLLLICTEHRHTFVWQHRKMCYWNYTYFFDTYAYKNFIWKQNLGVKSTCFSFNTAQLKTRSVSWNCVWTSRRMRETFLEPFSP